MTDSTRTSHGVPVCFAIIAHGCITGPCESELSVAIRKAQEMPAGTEVVPLYRSALSETVAPGRIAAMSDHDELDRLRVIEHLAWHVCESSEENASTGTIIVDAEDFKALSEALPMEHPPHGALPKGAKR